MTKKILYIRSGPYELNFNSYNLQEIGLGSAFCNAGYDFDLIYYSKKNRNQVIKFGDNNLTILWRKGIKILRTGIYPTVLNKKFLNNYDIVFVSEYSQIMSVMVSKIHNNTYLYHGPYYNMFKIPFMEKIYDLLFSKYINNHIVKIFSKTEKAKKFIEKKGMTHSIVTGVGLDISKFNGDEKILPSTLELIARMKGHRNLLYVGSIIKRKNIELIIKSFNQIKENKVYEDVQLILIGKGDESYTKKCYSLLSDKAQRSIIHIPFIENTQLKFIYKESLVFLLPSIKEIFGMVLLEAMYFGIPVISSESAGADTLIKNGENGVIVEKFDSEKWAEEICNLLDDTSLQVIMGKKASDSIKKNFMWDRIVERMIKYIR